MKNNTLETRKKEVLKKLQDINKELNKLVKEVKKFDFIGYNFYEKIPENLSEYFSFEDTPEQIITQAKYIRDKISKNITNKELEIVNGLVDQVINDEYRQEAIEYLEDIEKGNPILWESKIVDDLGTVYNMKDGSIKVRGIKDES